MQSATLLNAGPITSSSAWPQLIRVPRHVSLSEQREVSASTLTQRGIWQSCGIAGRTDWQTFRQNENFSEMDRHFNAGGGGSGADFAGAKDTLAAGASRDCGGFL